MAHADVGGALSSWLAGRLAADSVTVEDLVRHAEGFSWETYTFTAHWRTSAGPRSHGFALRREPAQGLLPPYDAGREFRIQAAVGEHSDVPLPRLHWLETDPGVLGRPFYVMDRAEGAVPVPWRADDPAVFPDEASRRRLGEDFIDVLARIHAIDVEAAGLGALGIPASSDAAASAEVERWAAVAEDSHLVREPLLDAAVTWLRGNVATSGRVTLVHGDYRLGNFMVSAAGRINAIFDWELAHVGDPVFDLAWAGLKLYRGRSPLLSRLLPIPVALERYSARSGFAVDAEVLHFWTVFAYLRALAPHLRAARVFQDGGSHDLRLANMGHQSLHLLKFLAEDLGLRRSPAAAATRHPTTPDGKDDAAPTAEGGATVMQNTPERLLRGGAEALRQVLGSVEASDPFVRSQLLAAVELLENLAPRVQWRAADLAELVEQVRALLRTAAGHAGADELAVTRRVLAAAVPDPSDVDGLLDARAAHLEALEEVQSWAPQHPGIGGPLGDLLGRQLDSELALLRAGSFA